MDDKRNGASYKDNCGLKHCHVSMLTVFFLVSYWVKSDALRNCFDSRAQQTRLPNFLLS